MIRFYWNAEAINGCITCLLAVFAGFFDVVQSQTEPYRVSLGVEGLGGLDASILREIAAALNPSRHGEPPAEMPPSTWSQPTQSAPSVLSPQVSPISPSCTGKGGFFPDYSQKCRVYYRCSPSGRMARFECPMNYVFSEQLKRCDQPELVQCTGKAYESLQPQNARAVMSSDPSAGGLPAAAGQGTQARLSSGSGGSNLNTPTNPWPPTLTYNDQASGFYETLLSAVNERPENAYVRTPVIRIMGDPQVTLDMDPHECYGRANQYIPDPDTGCRGYVKCPTELGKPYQSFICPTGMRFDLRTEQCLPRGQVRCMEVERLTPPGFPMPGLEFFPPQSPTGSPPPVVGQPVTFQPAISHCGGKTGFIPDYSLQCKVYYYCNADGSSLNLTCPAEMVFNPSLQSCDFFQTAPECRLPTPSPQKMRPSAEPVMAAKPVESRLVTVPSVNHHYKQRPLLPYLRIATPPTKRPSPGVENQSRLLSPGLLTSLPEPYMETNPLSNSMNAAAGVQVSSDPYPYLRKTVPKTGHPEPVPNTKVNRQDWSGDIMNNKVNTAYEMVKGPSNQDSQVSFLPKRLGQTVPGASVTLYETECDGTVAYHIEPESACRIYHFCHPNLTMETFSCPAEEVFLIRTKSCVSNTAALCIDPLSGDAREILHKNWEAVPVSPVATTKTMPLPQLQPAHAVTTAPILFAPGSAINNAPERSLTAKCSPGVNGMYGDVSTQCTTYFECQIDGSVITHVCPSNLKFNTNLKACDWPEYIDGGCNEIKRTI